MELVQDLVAQQTLCISLAIFPSLQLEQLQHLSLNHNHLHQILLSLTRWIIRSISTEMNAQVLTETRLFVRMTALVAGHGQTMTPTSGILPMPRVDACQNNVPQKAITILVIHVDQTNKARVMDAVAAVGAIPSMIQLNGALLKECAGANLMNSSLSSNTVAIVKTSTIMNVVKTVIAVSGHGRSMILRNGQERQLHVAVLQVRFEKLPGVKELVKTSTTNSVAPIVLTVAGLGKPPMLNVGQEKLQPVVARTGGDSN